MSLRLASALGIVVFIGLAWAVSQDRRRFPWRAVGWGLGLQFVLALLMLRTDIGARVFAFAQSLINGLLGFANEGSRLVFGPLTTPEAFAAVPPGQRVILAITVTSTIILISALSALLYHWGWLQRFVRAMAWVMQRSMRTSGSESLAAAANVFVGQTEAPLLVRPYIDRMTSSELLALMTGGMATIAGGVAAAYVSFGVSAGHLLTASVMSAPAALMMAKILLPETASSETSGTRVVLPKTDAQNSIDALCRGASDGLMLSLNVMAMLLAFVALVALANFLLGAATRWLMPEQATLSFQQLLGWLNAPLAWFMGIPAKDCAVVGTMLGERIVLNEFVAYLTLTQQQAMLDERSFTLATYALCGFANIGSIAVQIGGIGALAPQRRSDLARLGFRAMVGGLLACYLTAAIVGLVT